MITMYKLKGGHEVAERQMFLRTFAVAGNDERHTGKYFIDREKVYCIHPDTGEVLRCNFGEIELRRNAKFENVEAEQGGMSM